MLCNGMASLKMKMEDNNGGNSNGSSSPSISPKASPLHTSNDTLNSSTSVSSGVGSHKSSCDHSSSSLSHCLPGSTSLADYLGQLIKDRKQLIQLPGMFFHVERLLDEEISKVRVNLFQQADTKDPLVLPAVQGSEQSVTLTEKVFVPAKEHPDFNFVGRILGPRGMTAKQLEKETGCKIMIRGKGSMRDKQKEALNKGKPNWDHLAEDLHVLITVDDTKDRAQLKLTRAVDEINKLLVPMSEADDELKKRQLMELAIINGTYRDNSPKPMSPLPVPTHYYVDASRLVLAGAMRGAPLILPNHNRQHVNVSTPGSPQYYHTSPSPGFHGITDSGLLYQYDYPAGLQNLFDTYTSSENGSGSVGGVAKHGKRHLGSAREHPYSRVMAAAAAAALATGGGVVTSGIALPVSTSVTSPSSS